MKLVKIISGGQTGVDLAGLDTGIEIGLPIGGYVPTEKNQKEPSR